MDTTNKSYNITAFGATGPTGLLLIESALSTGFKVTAYARTPSKILISHENLKIIKGELTDKKQIEKALHNADAVISMLGPTPATKGNEIADGTVNIVEAMKKTGVNRLIATSTPAFRDKKDKFQLGFAFGVFMIKTTLKNSYHNILLTGKIISESNLDWTLVRLPMLSNKQAVGVVNAGYSGDGKVRLFSLTRSDLSDFLLKQVSDKSWLRKSPIISGG